MDHQKSSTFRRYDGQPQILLLEQDAVMLTALGAILDLQGYRVILARTCQDAVGVANSQEVDAWVLSIDDVPTGCQLAAELRANGTPSEVPIIFLVPAHSPESNRKLSAQGGVFSMLKPVDPGELTELIEKTLWMPHVARSRLKSSNVHWHRQSAEASPTSSQRQEDWISLSAIGEDSASALSDSKDSGRANELAATRSSPP